MQEKIDQIIGSLTYAEKDLLYRTLWVEHVKEDIEGVLVENYREEMTDEEISGTAEKLARQYCFDGDYDCNLCYWDNIDNLIARERGWGNE